MNVPNQHEIEERLRSKRAMPPEGLGEQIRSAIPQRPRVVEFPRHPARSRRRWAVAATIAVAVIGAGLVYRLQWESPSPDEWVQTDTMLRSEAERVVIAAPSEGLPVTEPLPTGEAEPTNISKPDAETSQAQAKPAPVSIPATETGSQVARDQPGERSEEVASAPREADSLMATVEPRSVEAPAPQATRQRLESAVAARPQSQVLADRVGMGRVVLSESQAMLPPSTGGTTEPNDQPYGDMFFKSWGVNPFIDTEDDNLSTFGLDVDTGSYSLARSYIDRGYLPPAEAIRIEELINYFDYGDLAPGEGDFAIHAEAAPAPFAEGPRYQLIRFGLKGREVRDENRKPATLIFTVDVSGSMAAENRLGLVKRSLELLLDQLRADDLVGLVVYGSRGSVLLEPTANHQAMRSAIGRLQPGGSTNAEEGLVLAYELAERFHRPGAIHRVVLCSDGVANVGRTGPESILQRIEAATEGGVELTTVGFGMGNYNDLLMEQLADRGDGSHAYVDTLDEARRVFVENLTGTLQTIAGEAKVQVEFDPGVVARYRLLGYENRDIADERFRDDTVDAGEVGAGHAVTALYEVKLRQTVEENDVLATLRLRYLSKADGRVVEVAEPIRVSEVAASWEQASPALRLSSLVAEFGEILRKSYWAREGDLEDVFARAQRLSAEFAGDVDVANFVSLVGRAARLASARAGD